MRRLLAWGVHFYTALGLACAAAMAEQIFKGSPASFTRAFLWMLAATVIDATDGTLARAVKVKEVLPGFSGTKLDDLVDFLTYVALPVLLVWRAAILPEGTEAILLLPLFASAYGFCQVEAKTPDGYFLGFPSYWNIVAFYLVYLGMPAWLNLALVVGLSLLTFVPLVYLYPSMKGRLNFWTNVLAVPWAGLLVAALVAGPGDDRWRLAVASLYYPAYYFAASWWVNVARWRRGRAAGKG